MTTSLGNLLSTLELHILVLYQRREQPHVTRAALLQEAQTVCVVAAEHRMLEHPLVQGNAQSVEQLRSLSGQEGLEQDARDAQTFGRGEKNLAGVGLLDGILVLNQGPGLGLGEEFIDLRVWVSLAC